MGDLGEILVMIVTVLYLYLIHCILKEKALGYYKRVVELEKSIENLDKNSMSECFQILKEIDKIKKKFLYKIFFVYL